MSQITVAGKKREGAGKGVARKLRAAGQIPGVLYGRDSSPIIFSTEEKVLGKLLKEHGVNMLVELDLEGEKHTCMVADYQKDVFQKFFTHIDFKLVDNKTKVSVKIPIRLQGVNEVRSRGGIAQLYMRDLHVKMLPGDIPKGFPLDVSALEPGDTVKLAAVETPDSMEKMGSPNDTVLNVLAPRALAAARVADDAEGDEAEAEAEG